MTTYGLDIVASVIAHELEAVLPGLDTDYSVIAHAVAMRIDHDAAETIAAREEAFQVCLQSFATYYGGLLTQQREELKTVRAERADLVLKLAGRPRVTTDITT